MPLYEYACRACGAHTDIRHGFDETNSEPCPTCGGELARVFSASGIVFKGSGFYINDSKKSSGGESSKDTAKGETAKGETAKGDAKTEASGGTESVAPPAEKKPSSDATAA